jgi:hypothetical protein
VNARGVDQPVVEYADIVGPELVNALLSRAMQLPDDVVHRMRVGYPGWLMIRTHPFSVMGHEAQPLAAFAENQPTAA